MKQVLLTLIFILSITTLNAQVGINTNAPKATLEVKGNTNVTTSPDGLIAPKITRAELIAKTAYATDQTGAIVYVSDLSGITNSSTNNISEIGYYFFDGIVWKSMNAGSSPFSIGDIKTGIQPTDHNGWIKLDGRLKSTLTTTQQTQATVLGLGSNLPNATNTYLSQNGSTLGTVTGTNLISRSNLPNVPVTGEINLARAGQSWTNNTSGVLSYTNIGSSSNNLVNSEGIGQNMARFNFNWNLNDNVVQQEYLPKTMSVNTFIYLGN